MQARRSVTVGRKEYGLRSTGVHADGGRRAVPFGPPAPLDLVCRLRTRRAGIATSYNGFCHDDHPLTLLHDLASCVLRTTVINKITLHAPAGGGGGCGWTCGSKRRHLPDVSRRRKQQPHGSFITAGQCKNAFSFFLHPCYYPRQPPPPPSGSIPPINQSIYHSIMAGALS